MRASFRLLLLLAVVGCDSSEDSIEPVFDDLIVSLGETRQSIQIETDTFYPNGFTLDVARQRTAAGLRIEVRGMAESEGPGLAVEGPGRATVPIDLDLGTYSVEIAHLGQTDVYRLEVLSRAVLLLPVRTEVSRPGPR